MDDKRARQRQRTFKGGSVSWTGGVSVDCIIRNLSETGALLELSNANGIPDTFTLIIKPELLKRSCQIAWRSESRFGVRFG
jgi:hypothetical protein